MLSATEPSSDQNQSTPWLYQHEPREAEVDALTLCAAGLSKSGMRVEALKRLEEQYNYTKNKFKDLGRTQPGKDSRLAKALRESSRSLHEELYRAVDIYFKAHPWLSDREKEELCNIVDYQKLSIHACAHASQNDRMMSSRIEEFEEEFSKIKQEMKSVTKSHSFYDLQMLNKNSLTALDPDQEHQLNGHVVSKSRDTLFLNYQETKFAYLNLFHFFPSCKVDCRLNDDFA
ncbi:hypothetical protein VNO77_25150 [Canavalia gladiata]|uniref:NPH3 domain-containing protein n=1 Tax=Canavalia gladiata TaxID=3824 RepID=A0AAN9L851_CANGL